MMSEQDIEAKKTNLLMARRIRNGNKNIYPHHPKRSEIKIIPIAEDPILTIQLCESTVKRLKMASSRDNKTYDQRCK